MPLGWSGVDFSVPLMQHDPSPWIDLLSKETQNLLSDSFGFKNPIFDSFLKKNAPLKKENLML